MYAIYLYTYLLRTEIEINACLIFQYIVSQKVSLTKVTLLYLQLLNFGNHIFSGDFQPLFW